MITPMHTSFQGLSATQVYVLGHNGNLWFETSQTEEWRPATSGREQVDGDVAGFQALDATHAYVLGSDHNLWLETAQSGHWGTVPPPGREHVDGNVAGFQALDAGHTYVLGGDGKLWFETGPWGTVPPPRRQVDGNVGSFQALDATHVFVLGSNGNLWSETAQSGQWGAVPPPGRVLEGTQVFRFEVLDPTSAYVLIGNSQLYFWPDMQAPRPGTSPVAWLVDANVAPLALSPAPATPSAPAALQISQDWPSITFPNGVPVGGYESLVMNPDGSCTFSGHFHDSGFPDYDVSIVVVVRDGGGYGYVFSAQGSMQGTIANLFSPNRDYNWTTTATNQTVATRWAELSAGWTYQGTAQATADWGSMLRDLLNAFQQAGQDISTVIEVIGPLVTA